MPVEAVITMKLAPPEFDLIRKALETSKSWCLQQVDNTDLDAADRRRAREEAARYSDVLNRLNS